jgi:putative tricarboxylic transport membrane protein
VKVNDAVSGALLAALGLAVLVHVQGFPRIPGQNVGPALFPGLLAAGLCVCGALLLWRGWRARAAGWIEWPAWWRALDKRLAFGAVVGVNLFYLLAVERLGFVPTGIVYLGALFAAFGVRRRWIVPLALALTLAVHAAFAKGLKVPLPWGLLQPIAW